MADEYIRLLKKFEDYMKMDSKFCEYPIGGWRLEIQFLYYKNQKEVEHEWAKEKRVS